MRFFTPLRGTDCSVRATKPAAMSTSGRKCLSSASDLGWPLICDLLHELHDVRVLESRNQDGPTPRVQRLRRYLLPLGLGERAAGRLLERIDVESDLLLEQAVDSQA